MTKPVLFVDTNFLIHIYGQATEDKPRGINYDPKMGEAILDDLSKKYDIRVTTSVLDEATTLDEFKAIRNWFDKNKGTKAVIYETPLFVGKNGGELSILDIVKQTGDKRDPTLPPITETENVKIASIDKLLKKSAFQSQVVSTQQVAESALAEGILSRTNYDLLGEKTGDILRARGGFKSAAEVMAEHGITLPAATAETATTPKPPVATETTPVTETLPVEKTPAASTAETKAPAPAPPPESGPAKATPPSKFVPESPPPETNIPAGVRNSGVGYAGASSIGIVLGAKGLHDAIETGDTTGGAIAATNIATSSAQATEGVLTAAGKTAPLLTKAGKFIPVVNFGATLVDGVYQISKEDTPEHMAERTAAVAATATTALALGTATATVAEASAITAGVTGVLGTGAAATGTAAVVVAAAPVVVTVAAVAAVAYTGEKAIEAKRAWDDVDRTIAENGAATKRRNYKADDGKPSVLGFKHIAVMMLNHSEHMKNENMNGTSDLGRNQKGRFKIEDFKKIDMRDPKNIAELERVLKESIAREDKIIKDNDSILPRWMRSSDSADKMTMAQMERADLAGAMQELQMYKKELRDYDKAHPDDPATTPPGGAKKPAARQQAPK